MRWADVVWEAARAIYSVGLLALGAVILASVPSAVRVIRELTAALTAASEGLRAFVEQREEREQIREQLRRIESAVTKK